MRAKQIAIETISILFIILWVYAGLSKLFDYSNFKFQLGRSPYIQDMAGIVAVALPIGELFIASLLIFNRTKLLGLYLSFFTMLLFTEYIYAMLNFSYFISCSCGGILSQLGWRSHLIFNIFFTFLAFVGVLIWSDQKSIVLEKNKQSVNTKLAF